MVSKLILAGSELRYSKKLYAKHKEYPLSDVLFDRLIVYYYPLLT